MIKEISQSEETFGPPARPVGNGNNTQDSQLSWILATICDKAADSLENPSECLSTEDTVHDQCCFSLDVKAMYPSLDPKETSDICAREVVRSGVFFTAINWEEMALFLVLNGQQDEISKECLPSTKYNSGPAPSITTAEAIGPITRKPEDSKFNTPVCLPSEDEKREIMFRVVRYGILMVMRSHTYKWNKEY